MVRRAGLAALVLLVLSAQAASAENAARPPTIGSKSFTESVILGEILAGLARKGG